MRKSKRLTTMALFGSNLETATNILRMFQATYTETRDNDFVRIIILNAKTVESLNAAAKKVGRLQGASGTIGKELAAVATKMADAVLDALLTEGVRERLSLPKDWSEAHKNARMRTASRYITVVVYDARTDG